MDNLHLIWNDIESRRRLTRVALAVLDSPVLAEEIVQEAYLRLLEKEQGSVQSPLSWLVTVTRNLALDQARRRMRERELLLLVSGTNLFEQRDGWNAAESRLAELVSCLLHVSNSHVTAMVLLHVVFGFSYEDIATFCGRSPASCRQAGGRALRKCFNALEKDEPYDDIDNADTYVHAILDASVAPLMDGLDVTTPVNMQCCGVIDSSCNGDSFASRVGRTRQVLVLTATGAQWALVLDGVMLCSLPNTISAASASAPSVMAE